MTIYLKFDTHEQAITSLHDAGFNSTDGMHFNGDGLAVLFQIPDGETVLDGWFVNIYDSTTAISSIEQFRVPDPVTPYNRLA